MTSDPRQSGAAHSRLAVLYDHHDELRNFARRHGERPHDADDVAADVYEVACRRIDDLPHDDNEARRWLFGVAHNVLHNKRRKDRRKGPPVNPIEIRDLPAGSTAGPPLAITIEVLAAWHTLPPDDRRLLFLVGMHGTGPHELAERLGCSVGAAMTRLSRARTRLGVALAADAS